MGWLIDRKQRSEIIQIQKVQSFLEYSLLGNLPIGPEPPQYRFLGELNIFPEFPS